MLVETDPDESVKNIVLIAATDPVVPSWLKLTCRVGNDAGISDVVITSFYHCAFQSGDVLIHGREHTDLTKVSYHVQTEIKNYLVILSLILIIKQSISQVLHKLRIKVRTYL